MSLRRAGNTAEVFAIAPVGLAAEVLLLALLTVVGVVKLCEIIYREVKYVTVNR